MKNRMATSIGLPQGWGGLSAGTPRTVLNGGAQNVPALQQICGKCELRKGGTASSEA